jgi:hypothetical protein
MNNTYNFPRPRVESYSEALEHAGPMISARNSKLNCYTGEKIEIWKHAPLSDKHLKSFGVHQKREKTVEI